MGLWSWRRRFCLEIEPLFMPNKEAAASAEIVSEGSLLRQSILPKILTTSAVPMIQNLETTLRAGAVPQVPQFRPLVAQPPQLVTTTNVKKSDNKVKSQEPKTTGNAMPPTVKLAEQQKYS